SSTPRGLDSCWGATRSPCRPRGCSGATPGTWMPRATRSTSQSPCPCWARSSATAGTSRLSVNDEGPAGAGPSHAESLEGLEDLAHELRRLGRGLADLDARSLEGLLLGLRGARGAGVDRAGVAHRLALGSRETRNVA